jgi:hypothetical protein
MTKFIFSYPYKGLFSEVSSSKLNPMTVMKILCFLGALATPVAAQDAALISAAKRTLEIAQQPSFDVGREHCGLLGQITGARYVATKPKRGWKNSCLPKDFSGNVDVQASYHTHGSYSPHAEAELPSSNDVEADMTEGVFGFIATPGGRMWMVDPNTGIATLLCGLGCLPQDPNFIQDPDLNIKPRYTLRELQIREAN